MAPAFAAASSGTSRWIPITVFSVLGVLVVAAIAVAGFLLTSSFRPSADPVVPPATAEASAEPSEEPSSEPSADPSSPSADGPISTSPEEIEGQLQAKIDEYTQARDSGTLWATIPDTEFNRTAVSAFLYFLTDMKVATIWGIDQATAEEYAQDAADLEALLLAQQPLGSDIEISFEDGRVFRYDGDTGEGGYFDE
jgi:hypothetical protein